ncbi:Spy/CpxP family protein refolding chaperone [Fulvivirga lutea]|uniref:Periplasmic heavy metal sensor n=1 Tax=Fulvivirga lutea TaxID=2810512 RepID=A0A974WK61_9BACT|nr:periplasmic heavy metal sensor [Fulvivirga lutea]QSE97655.1 periplasmic heavy metal sensor [Fulvivirga lutea]
MKQNKFLVAIIGILIIINLTTLAFLWNIKKGFDGDGPGKHRHEMYFERKLGLDEVQSKKFEESRRRHFEKMNSLKKEIRKLRNDLSSLIKEQSESEAKDIIQKIGEKHAEMELANFNHFNELRSYCTPKQQQMFDSIMNKVTSHPRRRDHRPH